MCSTGRRRLRGGRGRRRGGCGRFVRVGGFRRSARSPRGHRISDSRTRGRGLSLCGFHSFLGGGFSFGDFVGKFGDLLLDMLLDRGDSRSHGPWYCSRGCRLFFYIFYATNDQGFGGLFAAKVISGGIRFELKFETLSGDEVLGKVIVPFKSTVFLGLDLPINFRVGSLAIGGRLLACGVFLFEDVFSTGLGVIPFEPDQNG